MIPTLIIVFREVLEAALIVSIVLAATRGVTHRGRWIAGGIAAGLAGAVLVAVFAQAITGALQGLGQEVFNAIVLFLAVLMLGWHNVWMSRHARHLVSEMNAVGSAVSEGSRPLIALALVVGIAVLREGSEVVLFLHGIAAAGGSGAGQMLTGGALGLAGGAALGSALYLGLLRIPTRYLFSVTSWLILLLAAGMAAQAVGNLEQAGLLPAWGYRVWDSSHLLSERSFVGQVLHILIGYHAQPMGIQIAFYSATIVIIGGLMKLFATPPSKKTVAVVAAALITTGASFSLFGSPAQASDLKVYSPIVEEGEFALEARGNVGFDDEASKDGAQEQRYEIEYGVTDRWKTAIGGLLKKGANSALRYNSTYWENIYQVFEQGEMWLDFGIYLEYKIADDRDDPDILEFKPLFEKSFGRVEVTLNPIFEKEVGENSEADLEFEYASRVKYRWHPMFEPGIEAFGKLGEINNTISPDRQRHQLGPVIMGTIPLMGHDLALAYELGWLAGLTEGTADGTFKWLVELETYF